MNNTRADVQASANCCSRIESAKITDIEPHSHLRQLFTVLPEGHRAAHFEAPLRWTIDRRLVASIDPPRSRTPATDRPLIPPASARARIVIGKA